MGTPEQQDNKRAAKQIGESWSSGDVGVLDDVIAEDIVARISGLEAPIRGREAYKRTITMFRQAFPDMTVEDHDVVAEDDKVCRHFTMRGTHKGAFLDIEPTGRSIEIQGVNVARFDDGHAVEETSTVDMLGMLQQLGVLEVPADATEETDGTTTHDAPLPEDVVHDLTEHVRGAVLLPGDEGYDDARQIWNAMIDRRPAVIASCAGTADVISAVNAARNNDVVVSVKGGGHNVSGNAVCDDGLMIDLSPMTSVQVDPAAKTVRAEPGVTMADLDHETQAFGLATPGGVVSTTGVAGLTLGGGWGWLSRTYGLTIDSLRAVDIVTADGTLRHASEDKNEDLFWGVRGGGGNFGIVTSFEFDCYEVGPAVLAGLIIHPFEDAADLLRFHREFTADAPDELCCYAALLTAPPEPFLPEAVHGTTVLAFALCYSGHVADGEAVIQPLRDVGDPIVDLVDTYPYTEFQQIIDEAWEPGARNYWKSQFIDPLPDEAIDLVIEYAESRTSPLTEILIEHQGGAITQVNSAATAYPHRDVELTLNILSRWEDAAEDEEHIEWTQQFFEAMTPYAADGVYVNFLGQEGEERVKAAYGDNYDRLVELKNRYDPDNLFQMNQNIEPTV